MSEWPSCAEDLVFSKRLGRGFFGEVWQCSNKKSPESKPLAVKKVPVSLIQQNGLTEQMAREIAILRSLNHPHIVKLHFDFRDSSHFYLGMEFAEGGVMFQKLSSSGKFPDELASQYLFEICDALEYLHTRSEKVIHRDIKPENILFDGFGHVKLADFGWANMVEYEQGRRDTFCGTPDYLAPEMIRGQGHNEMLDMWEMGVLLYEMVVGKSPFGASSQEATCRNILKVDLRFPKQVDPDAQDLVTKLCRLRPEERLSAAQAKTHVYVRKFQCRETVPIGSLDAAELLGRPSVETRHLQRNAEILEGELLQILQAKSATEQKLLQVTEAREQHDQELKAEQNLLRGLEERLSQLKTLDEKADREEQELRRSVERLTEELRRLKSADALAQHSASAAA